MKSLLFWSAALAAVLAPLSASAMMLERQENILAMSVTITAWADDRAGAERALARGFDEIRRCEAMFSAFRQGSDISRINQDAGQRPVQVSADTLRLLQWARRISEVTNGAWDVTTAGFAWEYGFGQGDYRVPTQARLDQVKKLVNYKFVMLYPNDKTVLFKRDGMQIDLDGLVIAAALNAARTELARQNIRAASVNAGGNVTVYGVAPAGGPWQVGLRHPRVAGRLLATVPLSAGKVLTAGDDERFFETEGVRYHHILNPATGKPAGAVITAALLLPEKPRVDLPAAALMLLPPDQGLRLAESIPGAECLIVDKDKKVWLSRGWKDVKVSW
jgi:FAD:protein FMN transferase